MIIEHGIAVDANGRDLVSYASSFDLEDRSTKTGTQESSNAGSRYRNTCLPCKLAIRL